jgi:glucosylceramidase
LLCAAAFSQSVHVFVSSAKGERIAEKPSLHFSPGPPASEFASISVSDEKTYQKIEGFGASFLEAGLISLNALDHPDQEKVLRALFDPEKGAGFSAMKTVIGATDFQSAGPFYTYDDVPGDVDLKHFSIARDLGPNGLVTYIKRAQKYGKFVLQAPMDYPPDWMLYDVNSHQDVDPKYYDVLANYYLHYLQDYEKNGVFVDYLSLFNEPMIYTKIEASSIHDLLRDHVGPVLAKAGVKTKIQLSDANTRINAYTEFPTILDDPEARKYVAAVAYHAYGFKDYDKIADLVKRYPAIPFWQTEVTHCYFVNTPQSIRLPRYGFADGQFWGDQIIEDMESSASAWIYWNMILDEKGGPWAVSPIHGNPGPNEQHPVVIINRKTKTVTYTGLYYYLAHFSKFVRPGSVRIDTVNDTVGVRAVSFKRPDGSVVVVVVNNWDEEAKVNLGWKGNTVTIVLPASSIATAIWSPKS